jgi:hypothetical protein
MKEGLNLTILLIIGIGMLVLSVLSIIGLVYLTQIVFNAKIVKEGDTSTATITGLNQTKFNIAKVTVILLWVNLTLVVISTILQIKSY